MFNTIINGEYPSRWATGIIHPVYKKRTMVCQTTTTKLRSCCVLGNYSNPYLMTDCHLKTKYVTMMIPIKLVLKIHVTPVKQIICYLYYVLSLINKDVSQLPSIGVQLGSVTIREAMYRTAKLNQITSHEVERLISQLNLKRWIYNRLLLLIIALTRGWSHRQFTF